MDDHTLGLVLQYGNPGPATYSSANQEWHFARRLKPCEFSLVFYKSRMTETDGL